MATVDRGSARSHLDSAADFLASSGDAIALRTEALRLGAASIVFGVLYSYPLVLRLTRPTLQDDWDFNSELDWVAYHTVVHFHQFPLWNPYKCGGMGMLANPQARFLSPFFLLHILFGPSVGAHLEVVLSLALMWAGCYALARVLRLCPLAAVAAATVFCTSSWFPMHIGEGQLVMLPFAYLPWILASLALATEYRSWRAVVMAALLFAVSIGQGGTTALVYGAPLIGMFAIALALMYRSAWPLAYLLVAAAFGAGIVAIKVIPAFEMVRAHPREPWGAMAVGWQHFPRIFLWRDQIHRSETDRFFIEFSNYISPVFIALALSAILMNPRSALAWIVMAAVLAFAIRGDDGEIPIWRWLHRLPMGEMLRFSSRVEIPFTLCVGMIAACAIDGAVRRFGGYGAAIAAILIVAGAVDSLIVGTPYLWHSFDRTDQFYESAPFFRQVFTIMVFDQTAIARRNMGMVACYEYTTWPTSALGYNQKGYRGEQYMNGPGTVSLIEWSPNRLSFAVEAPTASTMVVNQNFDAGWKLVQGNGEIVNTGGLLAVKLPPMTQNLTMVYQSMGWRVGFAITILSLVIALWLWRNSEWNSRVHLPRRAS
jgi:hypothetical protein